MTSAVAITPNPVRRYTCQLVSITALNSETYSLELASPLGTSLDYQPGQYLQLALDLEGDGNIHTLSYSIANTPDAARPTRLQLLIHQNSAFSAKIITRLKALHQQKMPVTLSLGMGKAYLQTDVNLPHLLVAAGSGIAKIKTLTEAILASSLKRLWRSTGTTNDQKTFICLRYLSAGPANTLMCASRH